MDIILKEIVAIIKEETENINKKIYGTTFLELLKEKGSLLQGQVFYYKVRFLKLLQGQVFNYKVRFFILRTGSVLQSQGLYYKLLQTFLLQAITNFAITRFFYFIFFLCAPHASAHLRTIRIERKKNQNKIQHLKSRKPKN